MRATQAVDHRPGPIEICLLTFHRPVYGRRDGKVPQVADRVPQLDQPGAAAELRGMLDLQPFALGLAQSLVIADLENNVGNVLAQVANERLLGVSVSSSVSRRMATISCSTVANGQFDFHVPGSRNAPCVRDTQPSSS